MPKRKNNLGPTMEIITEESPALGPKYEMESTQATEISEEGRHKSVMFIGEERHPETYAVTVRPGINMRYTMFKDTPVLLPEEEAIVLLEKKKYGDYNFIET